MIESRGSQPWLHIGTPGELSKILGDSLGTQAWAFFKKLLG